MDNTKENTTVEINGKPVNGMNPEAVAEIKARKAAAWEATKPGVQTQGMMGLIRIKPGSKVRPASGGAEREVKVDSQFIPLKRKADGTEYIGIIHATGFDLTAMFVAPADAITFPDAATKSAASAPRIKVNDELTAAMIKACELVGNMPSGKDAPSSKSKTHAEWAQVFPNCTVTNVAAAMIAIEAFRADRAAKIAEAIKSGNQESIIAAIDEYGRAKSYEQDVRSTATNCGVL